jgi:hypothetical protein
MVNGLNGLNGINQKPVIISCKFYLVKVRNPVSGLPNPIS